MFLKDICDPIPDFYEEETDEEDDEEHSENHEPQPSQTASGAAAAAPFQSKELPSSLKDRWQQQQHIATPLPDLTTATAPTYRPQLPRLQSHIGIVDHLASPLLSRASTPGILGGTSNLSYFHHLPLSAQHLHGGGGGGGGSQTPLLATVAGGGVSTPLHSPHFLGRSGGYFQQQQQQPTWQQSSRTATTQHLPSSVHRDDFNDDPSTRPTTADSTAQQSQLSGAMFSSATMEHHQPEPDPTDTQIVLHVAYDGNVKMSLTAEILLDYPMPSFVGIPLKLNVTGINFDGVALLAYLKKRAHFCFLGPEDAEVLVGADSKVNNAESSGSEESQPLQAAERSKGGGQPLKMGDLLKEIRVETEIGQKDGGKQVLKNVSKVERFVLEQVQRIFEEEFVYPSFWTFLV